MRLRDTPEEAAFRAGLRAWLAEHVPRHRDAGAPGGWTKALHAAGYTGLTWPAAYGGRGLPPTYQGIYAEESALAEAPEGVNVIGLGMVGPTIVSHGTPEQQKRFLEPILSGEYVFCQGFSEPDAGSDLAAVRTRATATAGGWRVTGEKVWSSYAHQADWCLLLARTQPGSTAHTGLTCLLVDMRSPGVRVLPLRQATGDSDFNQIVLTDVPVPRDCVLGPVGEGWRIAMTTLAHERGTFGITLTARLAVEFDRLLRTVHDLGLADDPAVRAEVAELHVQLQGLRWTGHRTMAALARTGKPGPESSILKLHWSITNQRLAAFALRLLGPAAVLHGPDSHAAGHWQHLRLRSRANSIEGGTSEILRGIIAERVLGLPRTR
ncbi:Acyl-CoA dehydrogenase [Micromonospora phaseoli]|uniref:Acyl-CoA dehydrogenase n=1 Tax=Micromonospora phaseoli TaxID=1144548 RepID=A0A1H6YN75_9ACTN|nr:acyl-CoA dehydrogenase family protein [Micromonospora phaseoli]PZW00103.1 alkylation response protein AidB-like acyl-CoA dehydrogenase [Micromonospora phaseoli]GIJ79613.1 acyl-CoA dehydrogenase [Micromonospora phaseoli]SEJ38185.1 Acyl-CoA dehydrogenase [Micromonospora phaseoli]